MFCYSVPSTRFDKNNATIKPKEQQVGPNEPMKSMQDISSTILRDSQNFHRLHLSGQLKDVDRKNPFRIKQQRKKRSSRLSN